MGGLREPGAADLRHVSATSMDFPNEPARGDDILPWARKVTRAIRDMAQLPAAPGIVRGTRRAFGVQRKRTGSSDSIQRGFPWQVTDESETDPDSGEVTPRVAVSIDSWLVQSRRFDSKVTVTGLGEPFAIEVGDYIWLQVEWDFGTGDIASATIEHGERWAEYPEPVRWDDPESQARRQTHAFELLAWAEEIPPEETNYHPDALVLSGGGEEGALLRVVQRATSNLLLCTMCYEGDTVSLFQPYFLPGPPPE